MVLVYAIREQLVQTFDNLGRVYAWLLLLIIPIQILNYIAQAKTYQGLFKVLGTELPFKKLFKLSVELNFVNHVFPSGGVTGISYFGVRLKQSGLTAGKSTIVQLMKLVLMFLSFELMLIAGFIMLASGGKANGFVILLCGALAVLMIGGTAGFGYMVGDKRRIDKFFVVSTKLLNKIIQLVRWSDPETIKIDKARNVVNDIHENYSIFKNNRRQLQAPFWWSLAANLTEVMTIYVVYLAFGEYVNFGAVILAYAVANFAGLVSVLPGGVGVYEGLMTLTLASAGVSAAISLPVTIMYRVLSTGLQIPPGYFLYHRNLRRTDNAGKVPGEEI
ncbi:MAG: hypothetical protein JWM37_604 [Candidatus Saccharibacteria bacterium]|nr:hypothetical protein [Candidatus Saccharibacteria bacterium]